MAKVIPSPSLIPGRSRTLPDRWSDPEDLSQVQPAIVEEVDAEPSLDELVYQHPAFVRMQEALASAQQRADRAESQLGEIRESLADEQQRARETGYREGAEEAKRQQEAASGAQLESFAQLLKQLAAEKRRLVEMAEDTAVEVGFSVAVKLMGDSRVDDRVLSGLVKHALSQIVETEKVVVRLAPPDYARLAKIIRLEERQGLWEGVYLKADESILTGGCMLETNTGSLDARLDLQMQRLRDLLSYTRAHRQVGQG